MSRTFIIEVTAPDDNVLALIEAIPDAMSELDPYGSVVAYELDTDESSVISIGELLFE